MNEQLEKDIRAEIDKVKELKKDVGEINNHLSIIESLCKLDAEVLKQKADEAYQKGLEDIWECMKRIAFLEKPRDMREIFGCLTLGGVLSAYSASEAIEKLKAYEEKKESEIHVNDVVTIHGNKIGVVTRVDIDCVGADVLWEDGHTGFYKYDSLKKTNGYVDIVEPLNEIRRSK